MAFLVAGIVVYLFLFVISVIGLVLFSQDYFADTH